MIQIKYNNHIINTKIKLNKRSTVKTTWTLIKPGAPGKSEYTNSLNIKTNKNVTHVTIITGKPYGHFEY